MTRRPHLALLVVLALAAVGAGACSDGRDDAVDTGGTTSAPVTPSTGDDGDGDEEDGGEDGGDGSSTVSSTEADGSSSTSTSSPSSTTTTGLTCTVEALSAALPAGEIVAGHVCVDGYAGVSFAENSATAAGGSILEDQDGEWVDLGQAPCGAASAGIDPEVLAMGCPV